MKESKLLAGASAKGAVNTFVVRLDELNAVSPHLDPVVAARRLLQIADDLVVALYPDEVLNDDRGIPSTELLRERLHVLQTDEEVEEEMAPALPDVVYDVPFTEEAPS